MKIPKIKFNKIKIFFKKLPRILGEKAFLAFLFLLFISLILGGIIFYKYSILAEKAEPRIIEKPLQFKEKVYQEILNEWEAREKRFKETELKEYPDPFRID
ncbi:hypothetical protein MUP06_00460 [Patescibacteria group bacterium]|nr:hypothetical protein [Patescibacteria group bacterium]